MNDIKYGPSKHNPPNQELWNSSVINEIKRAIDLASKEAMELNGYIVIAKEIDGKKYVVKEYKDGSIETIKEIEKTIPTISGGVKF